MVAKGNKDGHRYAYSSGVKAVESEKWGRQVARERYGSLDYEKNGAPRPEDRHAPQKLGDANNLQGNYYSNNVRNDWRRGGGATQHKPWPKITPRQGK